jgi:uncharacterized membrane protein
MSTQQIIFIIAILIVLVLAVGWGRRGTRVTQIRHESDSKDGDDA